MPSKTKQFALIIGASSSLLLYAAAVAQTKGKTKPDTTFQVRFERDVQPVLSKCVGCHTGKDAAAGINLAGKHTVASLLKNRTLWEKVAQNVDSGAMPPAGSTPLTMKERDALVACIQVVHSQADCKLEDPGRVTMRRLNREEYNNTVRDLFGIDIRPADAFPSDDVGYGFDNIGDVLSVSPLLMEKYLAAAEKISEAVINTPESRVKTSKFDVAKLPIVSGDKGRFYSNGAMTIEHTFAKPGEYLLKIRAFGEQAGNEVCKMGVSVNGQRVATIEVPAQEIRPENYDASLEIKTPGTHKVTVEFLNDFYDEKATNPRKRDRNLAILGVELVGTGNDLLPVSETHKKFFGDQLANPNKTEAAQKVLTRLARRAYRRPVKSEEVERLLRYVALAKKEGESFEKGMQLAVQAMLVSPHFLFRVETDPEPNNPKAKRMLTDLELATRLSYFLWSSMPDEELLALAEKKQLSKPAILQAQVKRMLKSPKAAALADNFGEQWLTLRNLSSVAPDPGRFPSFNEKLKKAMLTETKMFFSAVVKEDRSVLDFIDARYTFLNEPLAKHYGIEGVTGENFRKVTLANADRGGLLTQASILTVTSNPTRTSPVKRGKWVLEQMLGTPPPPAPPNVPELDKKGKLEGTLRQRMEQHRENPACASCHARMDPLGFGLENFDAVGAWRTKDEGAVIDSSGTLPNGKTFRGAAQLKTILLDKKGQFTKNLAEKLLTYAIGRGLTYTDKCQVETLVKSVEKQGYRFSSLVSAVVQSDPFRKRRGDGDLK
jgi:mono/diheme cytochrome c family protein